MLVLPAVARTVRAIEISSSQTASPEGAAAPAEWGASPGGFVLCGVCDVISAREECVLRGTFRDRGIIGLTARERLG